MEAVPQALLAEVRDRYGVVADTGEAVGAGSASKLWRLDSKPPVVVRLSQYYTVPDQQWSCRVAAEFAGRVPEVIPALVGADGESVFVWQGQPVTVWPFVPGTPLDSQNLDQLRQAAGLLAQLHQAAHEFQGLSVGRLVERDDSEAEGLLPDRELDQWLRAWHANSGDQPVGWMHRDFFPGNVLCRDGQIVGLVDWDEAEWGPLINELASAVWEFAKSPSSDALVLEHAREFLAEYQRAGGPVRPSNALTPLMRERLRRDIAFWRRVQAADPVEDQAKVAAFRALRNVRLLP